MSKKVEQQNQYNKFLETTKQIEESNNTLHPYMMTVRFKFIPLSLSNIKQKYRFFTDATWTQYSKTYRFIEGGYRFEFTDTTEDYTILFQVDVSAGDNVINITGRKDGHTFILWNNGINFCSGPQHVPITYQFRR